MHHFAPFTPRRQGPYVDGRHAGEHARAGRGRGRAQRTGGMDYAVRLWCVYVYDWNLFLVVGQVFWQLFACLFELKLKCTCFAVVHIPLDSIQQSIMI